ncbi:hypothetical protein CT1869 [Chlorobaculum tepidum TLS]|uniref:Uncharacterized protein n=1 Tax=Chlorobaculum tepidum (strain ATCC 49652 / DSM 12025 / NBRC 103806 / TLS) TaxID=194439 RepID=Q8KBC0_CHLTE|nr:hypothetical protein CT1869 [Chlorobaculum tepidum TLS]
MRFILTVIAAIPEQRPRKNTITVKQWHERKNPIKKRDTAAKRDALLSN